MVEEKMKSPAPTAIGNEARDDYKSHYIALEDLYQVVSLYREAALRDKPSTVTISRYGVRMAEFAEREDGYFEVVRETKNESVIKRLEELLREDF